MNKKNVEALYNLLEKEELDNHIKLLDELEDDIVDTLPVEDEEIRVCFEKISQLRNLRKVLTNIRETLDD